MTTSRDEARLAQASLCLKGATYVIIAFLGDEEEEDVPRVLASKGITQAALARIFRRALKVARADVRKSRRRS